MEKVKLTREQAEAIEELLKLRTKESIAREKANPFSLISGYINESSRLVFKDMAFDTLIKALYIGYEVEETFKVGDCVVLDDGKIVEIIEEGTFTFIVGWIANGSMYKEHVSENKIKRHATKQEKWWAKHGRDVWGIKKDDILVCPQEQAFTVERVSGGVVVFKEGSDKQMWEIKSGYKVICFAEDRKDNA